MSVRRRSFLKGALAGAGAMGAVAGGLAAPALVRGGALATLPAASTVPFHGAHQAGVALPAQAHSMSASFDVIASGKAELLDLFRTLTDRARALTEGGAPAALGITAPSADSGVLGPAVAPDRLTVMVGVGASLFDERYGLGARKPARLTSMKTFPNDSLDPAWCHGDVLVQLGADNADAAVHALRDIARTTRGAMQVRWRMGGFVSPPRPSGTPRNLMGFKDGIANPDVTNRAEMARLVWVGRGGSEPAWTEGGSYQVMRLIRMRVEFWDRVSVAEQENIIGRRRDTGAPLDGVHERDVPQFASDPIGNVIPLTSHIRRANPRTKETDNSRILRRAFNYDQGIDAAGNLDMGLIFTCFQRDIEKQFETVQKRLVDEPLVDYISPFGGGYFFVLPGVRGTTDHFGRALLA